MTINELIKQLPLTINSEGDLSREISKVFCCDLLSVAMGKAPADCAWVTVMGNVNTLAVASLTDAACVTLAEGTVLDEVVVEQAKTQGITVLATTEPVFDMALQIHQKLTAE